MGLMPGAPWEMTQPSSPWGRMCSAAAKGKVAQIQKRAGASKCSPLGFLGRGTCSQVSLPAPIVACIGWNMEPGWDSAASLTQRTTEDTAICLCDVGLKAVSFPVLCIRCEGDCMWSGQDICLCVREREMVGWERGRVSVSGCLAVCSQTLWKGLLIIRTLKMP